ncbi:hypothetical protein L083_5380 [Actinoplanes sp. N902-109]|nr:hypothetical protein L083_5380 [Actinoplanes sp. N902-109]
MVTPGGGVRRARALAQDVPPGRFAMRSDRDRRGPGDAMISRAILTGIDDQCRCPFGRCRAPTVVTRAPECRDHASG